MNEIVFTLKFLKIVASLIPAASANCLVVEPLMPCFAIIQSVASMMDSFVIIILPPFN